MNGISLAALESLYPCARPGDLPMQLSPARPSSAQPSPTRTHLSRALCCFWAGTQGFRGEAGGDLHLEKAQGLRNEVTPGDNLAQRCAHGLKSQATLGFVGFWFSSSTLRDFES